MRLTCIRLNKKQSILTYILVYILIFGELGDRAHLFLMAQLDVEVFPRRHGLGHADHRLDATVERHLDRVEAGLDDDLGYDQHHVGDEQRRWAVVSAGQRRANVTRR